MRASPLLALTPNPSPEASGEGISPPLPMAWEQGQGDEGSAQLGSRVGSPFKGMNI